MKHAAEWFYATITLCSIIALNAACRPEDKTILRPRWW